MSASTDPAGAAGADGAPRRSVLAAAWRPGGLIYLAWCLTALAAGLWPHAIYPSPRDVPAAPLPALQCLAAGQAAFILLVHPLMLFARGRRDGDGRRYWAETIVESFTWLVATVPLYVAAAWLADATAADVIRAVIALVCLWPMAWSAGAVLRGWKAARPAIFVLLLAAAALPAGYYILTEFLKPVPAAWLWDLAPVTFAWQTARSRASGLLPQPAWALIVWPAVAAALGAIAALRGSRQTAVR